VRFKGISGCFSFSDPAKQSSNFSRMARRVGFLRL
jgi:hypothetical protein